MSRIRLHGVSKTYRSKPPVAALVDVDLVVEDADLTVILGPSGCGKSTLLRIVAGFEQPDAGSVWLGDDQVATATRSSPPEARRVGIVPQYGTLFPHLDVSGNIRFALSSRRSAAARARADELLELVGLSGLGQRKPHELSGGQQQRVALARALAPRPRVVLLDEPFTALDAALRSRLQADVRTALRESHATALMVTHDPAEALAMGDSVAVLSAGHIEQTGPGHDVYFNPINESVARALGAVEVIQITSRRDATVDTPFGSTAIPAIDPSTTTILVRPEQIVLDPRSAARALVQAVQFNGADATVTLVSLSSDGAGSQVVHARCRSDDLPEVGTVVGVGLVGTALTGGDASHGGQ